MPFFFLVIVMCCVQSATSMALRTSHFCFELKFAFLVCHLQATVVYLTSGYLLDGTSIPHLSYNSLLLLVKMSSLSEVGHVVVPRLEEHRAQCLHCVSNVLVN